MARSSRYADQAYNFLVLPALTNSLSFLGRARYTAPMKFAVRILTYFHQEITASLEAAGKLDAVLFTPNGPAGAFAVYVTPGSDLGRVFLNEFVCVCVPRQLT